MARRANASSARRPLRPRLRVEALEDRCVPASTALASGGVLTIAGDTVSLNQSILIAETSTPGAYSVTISDNGEQVVCQTFTGITDVVVNAGAGSDTVNLSGDLTSGTGLSGNLTILGSGALTVNAGTGGSGGLIPNLNDFLTVNTGTGPSDSLIPDLIDSLTFNASTNGPAFNVYGQVTISDTGTGPLNVDIGGAGTTFGATTISGSSGADSISLQSGAVVNGSLLLALGGGDDGVSLDGATVSGAVTVRGGAGADTLSLDHASVGALDAFSVKDIELDHALVSGNVSTFFTGQENFSLTGRSDVQGYVSLNSEGNSQIQVDVSDSNVDRFFSIEAGQGVDSPGNDSISFSDARIGDNLGIDLGSGADTVALESVTLGRNLFLNATGQLQFSLDSATVAGHVSLNEIGSASADTVCITDTRIDRYLSIISGDGTDTVGNNVIHLRNSSIGTNFGIDLDGGNDTVSVQDSAVAGNLFIYGTGALNVTLSDTVVHGHVSLNETGGASANTVCVTDSQIDRFLSVITGNGADTAGSTSIHLSGTTIGSSFGADVDGGNATISLTDTMVAGNVFVNGTGNLDFTLAEGSVVNGYVSVNMTGAASTDTVNLSGSIVGDNVAVAGAGNDSIHLCNDEIGGNFVAELGAGNDTVAVRNSTIEGDVSVTNTGSASVSLHGTAVAGNVTLTLGAGDDTITLTGMAISGATAITAGAGNDSVTITDSTFTGATTVDTGAGADAVTVETEGESTGSRFLGPVTMSGTGNLTVALGAGTGDLAIFFGSATFTGGDAGSSLDGTDAQFDGGSPSISGFTTVIGA